jgi:hypothetical protein
VKPYRPRGRAGLLCCSSDPRSMSGSVEHTTKR